MNRPTWTPHAYYFAPPRAGQIEPAPPPPPPTPLEPQKQEQLREQRVLDQIASGFREITWGLIATGIAIGFASAVGNALGTLLVDKYVRPKGRS